MKAYFAAMKRYSGVGGRMSRADFWLFYLVYVIILVVVAVIEMPLNIRGGLLVRLVALAHLIPQLSALGRRLHDRDWHAAWALLPPVAFVVALLPGTPGPNRYGPLLTGAQAATPGPRAGANHAPPLAPVNSPESRPEAPPRVVEPTIFMPAPMRPAMSPSPRPPPAVGGNAIDQIERLARLRAEGHLTAEEFQALKVQALRESP